MSTTSQSQFGARVLTTDRSTARHRASRRSSVAGQSRALATDVAKARRMEAQVATRVERTATTEERRFAPQLNFIHKVLDDGVANFAGMLAYSLLLSVAPLLFGTLGIISFAYFLTGHTSANLTQLITSRLSSSVPSSGINTFTQAAQHNAGTIGIIGVITAIIAGAGFFQNVDYAFSIINRLKQRSPLREWLMSICMVLLLIPLVLIILLASSVPSMLGWLVGHAGGQGATHSASFGVASWLLSLLFGVLAAFILFSAIYVVVPNQDVPLRDVCTGAILAAVLLEAYTLIFPFYTSHFLNPSHYGASMGFAIVLIVFFYFFSIILLLGSELNSWLLGRRDLKGSIPAILHQIEENRAPGKPESANQGVPLG